jgi:TPR repeat protein
MERNIQRKTLLAFFLVLSSFICQAQIVKPTAKPNDAEKTKAVKRPAYSYPSSSSQNSIASLLVSWKNDRTVKLIIEGQDYALSGNSAQTIQVPSGKALELAVKTADGSIYKPYDFLIVERGNGFLNLGIEGKNLSVTYESQSEHSENISLKKQQAYSDAEAEYQGAMIALNAGDYSLALSRIETAEQLVPFENSSYSHLKIQVLYELAKLFSYKDANSLLLASCTKKYLDQYALQSTKFESNNVTLVQNIQENIKELMHYAEEIKQPEFVKAAAYYSQMNYAEAMTWYMHAAENRNNLAAMDAISDMYRDAIGRPADFEQSLFWDKKAADLGYSISMVDIGLLYRDGRGVPINTTEAIAWLKRSAEKGNTYAMAYLGRIFENGNLGAPDYKQAMFWYRKSAEKGDDWGMFELGRLFNKGIGVQKDFTAAYKWYYTSALKGNEESMNQIGLLLYNGNGVAQNYTEAQKWWTKASALGHETAPYNIGILYFDGLGVEQNYSEAFGWFQKSAEKGLILAMTKLSLMYANGWGVQQNNALATIWSDKAEAAKKQQ